MITKQVLQIDYKDNRGLTLSWKYTDLNTYQMFYRHVIVLFSDNKQQLSKFLKTYIKKMRPGDLYTILYQNQKNHLKLSKWKEKMVTVQTINIDFIIQDNPIQGVKQALMSKVEQQFGQFSEPTIVTIYTDNPQNRQWFQWRIEAKRCNDKYDFIVGIFGPFKSAYFSFSSGICTIPFVNHQDQEGVQFFFNQVYQSAVIWAHVTIQCTNGPINSKSQDNWRNINFNTIEKMYRGLSIKYEKDYLLFFRQKQKQTDYNFILKLTYVTLQRRKYFSEKRFSIHSYESFHHNTYNAPTFTSYHAFGDVWLEVNPFKTLTVLKLQSQNKDQQC